MILEINDEDFGEEAIETDYTPRTAARAVLFDGDKIAILFVSKKEYHKLPGGGVEPREGIKQTLLREIQEETGCEAEIGEELGEVIEHKSKHGKVQTSHCFLAKVTSKGKTNFTEKELNDGFQLKWVSLKEAIELFSKDEPKSYTGKFVQKRDLFFLKKAKKII